MHSFSSYLHWLRHDHSSILPLTCCQHVDSLLRVLKQHLMLSNILSAINVFSLDELQEGSKVLRDVLELDLANMQKAKPKDSPTTATICDRCGRNL